MLDFSDKVVVLTGGNGGIGAATGDLFLKRGAKVVSTDISFPSVDLSEIDFRKNLVSVGLDVTNSNEVAQIMDRIIEECGGIDVVVNGAGILTTKPILEIDEGQFDRVLAINLKGTFFVCQSALKHMIKRRTGSIVNISSLSGKIGGIIAGADYSASKAAVICLTKSFAKAGAPYSVRVNSIAPGGINTSMVDQYYEKFPESIKDSIAEHPFKRLGEPIEVANTILFLTSEESSYITGACIDVNGGYLMD